MIMAENNKNILISEKRNSGFTLIEMLVYVALFGVIMGMIFNMILLVYGMNKKITSYSVVTADAQSAMERIVYEVTNAEYLYLPTSNFANYNYDASKSGQLSIATGKYATVNDDTSFMDFYAENGTLFLKMDGSDPVPLTSSNVTVSGFSLDYFKNGKRESVRINLSIETAAQTPVSISLTNAVTIR